MTFLITKLCVRILYMYLKSAWNLWIPSHAEMKWNEMKSQFKDAEFTDLNQWYRTFSICRRKKSHVSRSWKLKMYEMLCGTANHICTEWEFQSGHFTISLRMISECLWQFWMVFPLVMHINRYISICAMRYAMRMDFRRFVVRSPVNTVGICNTKSIISMYVSVSDWRQKWPINSEFVIRFFHQIQWPEIDTGRSIFQSKLR